LYQDHVEVYVGYCVQLDFVLERAREKDIHEMECGRRMKNDCTQGEPIFLILLKDTYFLLIFLCPMYCRRLLLLDHQKSSRHWPNVKSLLVLCTAKWLPKMYL